MIRRWSLQSLADLATSTPQGAQTVVQDVTSRLTRQITLCKELVAPRVNDNQALSKDLKHLLFIHEDTHRLCSQLATQSAIYSRWNQADQRLISSTLAQVRNRHASTIERWVDMVTTNRLLQESILQILRGRLGMQLLCDHGVQQLDRHKPQGAVTMDCSIVDCLEDAYTEAKFLCDAHWQVSPDMDYRVDDDVLVTCVRPWILHAMVELFKNAMNATVCDWDKESSSLPPPIHVTIVNDGDFVQIDIQDQGRGLDDLNEHDIETILFGLGVSSADKKWDRLDEQQSYAMVRSPLSSLGVGLPMSRMMMEHFGGTVTLRSSPSIKGVVASIRLPRDTGILERDA